MRSPYLIFRRSTDQPGPSVVMPSASPTANPSNIPSTRSASSTSGRGGGGVSKSGARLRCRRPVVKRKSSVSRAISDFAFCTYLSDLAVDEAFQRRGIGRELIRLTHEAAGLHTALILLAAPKSRDYYPHVGMVRHDSCWTIPRKG